MKNEIALFHGMKIVELAGVLAGPAVGMFFAELGAEVIKVENGDQGGDITRKWKLPSEDPASPVSAYYAGVNWGKRPINANLESAADREAVSALIRQADIVVANFKHSSAKRLGMDYASLAADNPGLIYAQVEGFGGEDERPAFDVVLQAETGFMSMTGDPGGLPAKLPVALIDILAAHQLKEGVLVALLNRTRTGRGALVRVSLWDAAIASLANQASNWLMAGHIPQPMGSLHPNIAPYGEVFYCADDKALVLAVGTDRHFEALCRCVNLPDLPQQPEFAHNAARVRNRRQLQEILSPVFKSFTRKELMARLDGNGVPAGRIRNMAEVFALEEAKRLVLEEDLPDGTPTKRVRTAVFNLEC